MAQASNREQAVANNPGRQRLWGVLASLAIAVIFAIIERSVSGLWLWSRFIVADWALQVALTVSFYVLCGSWRCALITQGVFLGEFLALNLIKTKLLGGPILPSDAFLLPELHQIVGHGRLYQSLGLLLALNCAMLFLAVTTVFRNRALKRGLSEKLVAAVTICYFAWLMAAPASYYTFFDEHVAENNAYLYRERELTIGTTLVFSVEVARFLEIHNRRASRQQVADALRWLKDNRAAGPETRHRLAKPLSGNIYIILAESFWEPATALPDDMRGRKSYLSPEFNALWAANGHRFMLTPSFGGRTANAEFEVLCGIPARAAGSGIIFMHELLNPVPCLPAVLRGRGYRAFAFHPNNPGFYNRELAYDLIGFERFFSIGDFDRTDTVGEFLSDDSFIGQSVARARKEAQGKPFLAYMMTIAGHYPYYYSEKLHGRRFEISGNGSTENGAVIFRGINLNYHVSEVHARWAKRLLAEDPGALVVITGDHQAGIARLLSQGAQDISAYSDPRWYQTPLLVLGSGSDKGSEPFTAAYELGRELLERSSIDQDLASQFAFLRLPDGESLRPLSNGSFIHFKNHHWEVCTHATDSDVCSWGKAWLDNSLMLGRDLTAGHQYLLSN